MKGKEGRLLEEKKGGGVDGWEQVAPTSRGRIVGGGTRSLLSHGRADADKHRGRKWKPSSGTLTNLAFFVVLLPFDDFYQNNEKILKKSHFLKLYFLNQYVNVLLQA